MNNKNLSLSSSLQSFEIYMLLIRHMGIEDLDNINYFEKAGLGRSKTVE